MSAPPPSSELQSIKDIITVNHNELRACIAALEIKVNAKNERIEALENAMNVIISENQKSSARITKLEHTVTDLVRKNVQLHYEIDDVRECHSIAIDELP